MFFLLGDMVATRNLNEKMKKQFNFSFGMETWWPPGHLMLDCE
jgi:hypothetical protein